MKRAITIITLALAMIMLAATLAGCSSAQAAPERIVLSAKEAAAPADTAQIVLGLGNGHSGAAQNSGAIAASTQASANTLAA